MLPRRSRHRALIQSRDAGSPLSWAGRGPTGWNDPNGISKRNPTKALDALGPLAGTTVADVGAGSGYFTVRLATRVGAKGRVYASDLQPEMLKLLGSRLARERIVNVTVVQGRVDDPRLPPSSLDLALLVDVYHEFSEPQKMLRGLRAALKPGGRLVLLEYRKEDPDVPIRFEHKMSVAEAKLELEAEGFKLANVDQRLPRQHILVFTNTQSTARPTR